MGCGTSRKIDKENKELTSKGMPVSRKKIMDFHVRREINDLTSEELVRFFDAVRTMMHNKDGKHGTSDFFRIAGTPGWPNYYAQMGSETFALWHRALLVEFEQALQKADKINGNDGKIALPYWDWAHNTFPIQVYELFREFPKHFFPENDPNSEEFQQVMFTKRRSPQEISDYIKASRAPELAQQALSTNEYWKFSSTRWRGVGASVEAANNAVHMACGYPMSSMKFAAYDILYWLHHSNVDRYFTKYLLQDFDAYQEFYNSQKIIAEIKDQKNLATLPLEPFRHPQSHKPKPFASKIVPRDCFEDTKTMGYLYDVLPPNPPLKLEDNQVQFSALFQDIQIKQLNGKSFMLHVFAVETDDEEFELPTTFEKIVNNPHYAGFTSIISGLDYWQHIDRKDDSKIFEYEPINATVDISQVIKRLNIPSEKIALKVVCEDEYAQYFNIQDVNAINIPRIIGPFFENNDKEISKKNARENYNIQKYLQAVGYYAGVQDGVFGEQTMHAIKEFQKAIGLQSDGVLGVRTKQFFLRPRHDLVRDFEAKTSKFAQISERFNFKEVKFWIGVQPGYIVREEMADEIEQAIKLWDNHDNGIFTKVTQVYKDKNCNIRILFDDLTKENFLHYDGIEGNLVKIDGNTVTFDLSRKWLLKHMAREANGFKFQEVFLHAFGHILGIEHSLLPGNIMYPYYEEGVKRLGSQDLHTFNTLYTKGYKTDSINRSNINSGPNQSSNIGPSNIGPSNNSYNNKINMNKNHQGIFEHNIQTKSKITDQSNFSMKGIKEYSSLNNKQNYDKEKVDEMTRNVENSKLDSYYKDKDMDQNKPIEKREEYEHNTIQQQSQVDSRNMKREEDFSYIQEKRDSTNNNTNILYNNNMYTNNKYNNNNINNNDDNNASKVQEIINNNQSQTKMNDHDQQYWKDKLENNNTNQNNNIEPNQQNYGY